MDGRLRISKAIKLLKKFEGQTIGMISLRNLISMYITSNEKAITSILTTLGNLGVLNETKQFQFKINTSINIDEELLKILEEKETEVEVGTQ